ncbi:hemicentin-1-like [Tachyglossus aculeatus]|uniref:hemicentin-1-like n=1 Tax=Tachyglossus aculeatus TaxID=9261 RepID=UPI0018F68D20|nr:hemicentin-1-like [Tachyglossus aculeatus]
MLAELLKELDVVFVKNPGLRAIEKVYDFIDLNRCCCHIIFNSLPKDGMAFLILFSTSLSVVISLVKELPRYLFSFNFPQITVLRLLQALLKIPSPPGSHLRLIHITSIASDQHPHLRHVLELNRIKLQVVLRSPLEKASSKIKKEVKIKNTKIKSSKYDGENRKNASASKAPCIPNQLSFSPFDLVPKGVRSTQEMPPSLTLALVAWASMWASTWTSSGASGASEPAAAAASGVSGAAGVAAAAQKVTCAAGGPCYLGVSGQVSPGQMLQWKVGELKVMVMYPSAPPEIHRPFRERFHGQQDSRLLIDPCKPEDSGNYTLVVSPGQQPLQICLHVIKPLALPEIMLSYSEGNTIAQLTCRVAVGTADKYDWKKNGKPLYADDHHQFSRNKSVVQITNVTQIDEVSYSCNVSNEVSWIETILQLQAPG